MNVYTCEICEKGTSDYAVVTTPFYFEVRPGLDNNAWGEHSNEAKYCDEHVEDYEWPIRTSDLQRYRPEDSPRSQVERGVIRIVEERRIAEGVEPDYFFAPNAEVYELADAKGRPDVRHPDANADLEPAGENVWVPRGQTAAPCEVCGDPVREGLRYMAGPLAGRMFCEAHDPLRGGPRKGFPV